MFKSKRKELSKIWDGDYYTDIGNIVRFAPSACNLQPWIVKASPNKLEVYRYSKKGKIGIMPKNMVTHYNQIDIGIFLCFLELCLNHNKLEYDRTLFIEDNSQNEINLTAIYNIK